jgi:hypothetical protein
MKKKTVPHSQFPIPQSTYYRERVSTSYADVNAKTGEWFRTIISFGALLDEVAAFLGKTQGRDGEGLRVWLSENCPEVNYNTAMGYKSMATKCAKMLGGGTQAIAALQGLEVVKAPGANETIEIDAEVLEKRDQLFETVDSRRKLEQMYLDFFGDNKPKARHPKGDGELIAKLSPIEEAKVVWSNTLLAVNKTSVRNAIPLLPEKETQLCVDTLSDILTLLKDHLKEY